MDVTKLSANQKLLRKRILEISNQAKSSHLGSCLTAVDLIEAIYEIKKPDEPFILSNGHAGVALYAVLEKFGLIREVDLSKLHVHPDRDYKLGIDVSSGSLGQGLPIAVGMALSDRFKQVYCLVSDGECTQGSIWEALRISADQGIDNLNIIVNANGWGAYDPIDISKLERRLSCFVDSIRVVDGQNIDQITKSLKLGVPGSPNLVFAKTSVEQFPFLKGQDAHYYVLSDRDYQEAMKILQ